MLGDKKKKYIDVILLLLMPLVAGILYAALSGKSLFQIYLPAGIWNDEVSYFKQIQAVVEHNIPYGYWGYNESSANLLSFGAWSFILFIPYVIWGKLFGWNYFSPIACNIALMMLAYMGMGLLSKRIRMSKKWVFFWTISFLIVTRYVLSGMVEAFNYSMIILMLAFVIHMTDASEEGIKYRESKFYLLLAVISLLTLMRPYYLLLNIILLYFARQERNRKKVIIIIGTMIITLCLYFYISSNYCAPYFTPIINTKLIDVFLTGDFVGGIRAFIFQCIDGFKEIARYIGERGHIGIVYSIFGFQSVLLLGAGIYNIKRKNTKQGSIQLLFCLIDIVQIFAIIIFYSIPVGNRHLLPLCIINSILIIAYQKWTWKIALIVVTLVLNCMQINNVGYAKLPFYEESIAKEIEEAEIMFDQSLILEDEISWNNSVSYFFYDEIALWYVYLYALPSGFSIQYDHTELLDDVTQIRSAYIFVAPGGLGDSKMQELQAELICQHEDWKLYKNPRYQLVE